VTPIRSTDGDDRCGRWRSHVSRRAPYSRETYPPGDATFLEMFFRMNSDTTAIETRAYAGEIRRSISCSEARPRSSPWSGGEQLRQVVVVTRRSAVRRSSKRGKR
jgi:hypothetical protein